jgi:hypothetical protein
MGSFSLNDKADNNLTSGQAAACESRSGRGGSGASALPAPYAKGASQPTERVPVAPHAHHSMMRVAAGAAGFFNLIQSAQRPVPLLKPPYAVILPVPSS